MFVIVLVIAIAKAIKFVLVRLLVLVTLMYVTVFLKL